MSDIVVAPDGPPPGSGTTTLTERDRRLAARHEERRCAAANVCDVGGSTRPLITGAKCIVLYYYY